MQPHTHPWARLGLGERPIFLAPLAGVSDHPFRRLCALQGATLTYVEMLSATALLFESPRTYGMMDRHPSEPILGVQLTGKSSDETARAVAILDALSFETIDLNMGCPVAKVVKSGCGSAILRDPKRVYETVKLATEATGKPLSVKIRLGWDRHSYSYLEVADAAAQAGAAWLTIHGRLRCDDYSVPVDLERIAEIKRKLTIPVVGNGNIFSRADAVYMQERTGVDAVMVSRGALGNPWIFRDIAGGDPNVTIDEWRDAVLAHLKWQAEAYGLTSGFAAVCMRKHLLWYVKGWPGAKKLREQLSHIESLEDAGALIDAFAAGITASGDTLRLPVTHEQQEGRFVWDPKYEMDRKLDRGVGDELMSPSESASI
ncbi:MAG: tRNA-dihydrouridine synthase [Proteobacteria bacterium]|nr:tRNA-dihydrouridine synthase [Pseudomonadota bacterium]